MEVRFAEIPFEGRHVAIEYRWIRAEDRAAPLVVFLHEGLGSVAMWKHWPAHLCAAGHYRGLVYSRYGYGRSTPRPPAERWSPINMHRDQALEALPRFLEAVGVDTRASPPWLLGHSDGGSIALIHAAEHPDRVAGVIAIAPHINVEDLTIASIAQAREAYLTTDLRSRLAKYHADPDSTFWGWNDLWLDPEFRAWSIEAMLPKLRCPVLAVQGLDDEYGTLAQVEGIRRRAPQTEVVVLEQCGHSAHRDQPEALTRAVTDFMSRHAVAHHRGGLQ